MQGSLGVTTLQESHLSPTHAPSFVTVLLTEITGVHLLCSGDKLFAGGEAQVNVCVQCL
jgi:hypothetical protein